MKALLSWMQEFAPIPDDPEEVAAALTDLGMVVEDILTVGASLEGIVVAKVLELGPHPQADRIQLVQVDSGDGEPLQVCCGAFNMSPGDLVPLAIIGTTMASGMEIAARKMRGEASNGMLCSAGELELPEVKGTDGILILDSNLKVGQPLADALGQKTEIVFDLDIEGNRPDALSVAGVTRDLAARLGVPFKLPSPEISETTVRISDLTSVTLQDKVFCPRFGVRVLTEVTTGESPAWMQQRLAAAGMRPINAIVDISNYVMLELGQPNHTYDLDKVPDGALLVRKANAGETLTTLDGIERSLIEEDGVIANNAAVAIGLAGVMGGASTEVSSNTTSVLLEAAVWDRMPIAWTARRLNLRSEASTRFERGVDPFGIELALDRFAQLAVEICGASIAGGHLVVAGDLAASEPITVRLERVNTILNLTLTAAEVIGLLEPIGFKTVENEDGSLLVTVPTWRHDASIEEDITEEIGRHNGYSKSGMRVPTPTQAGKLTEAQTNRRRLRRAFLSNGYSEALPMPFIAPLDLENIGSRAATISITQPLVAEESILRPTLLPGLLKTVAYNQTHRISKVQLYELGKVFRPGDAELPDEIEMVAAIKSGFSPSGTAAEYAVRSLHTIAASLGLQGISLENGMASHDSALSDSALSDSAPSNDAHRGGGGRLIMDGLHPNRSATIYFRGRIIGCVGEVDPTVSERYGIDGRVAWLSLATSSVLTAMSTQVKYKPISRFPSSDIDLAFLAPKEVSAIDVARTIQSAGEGVVQTAELFDVFRSDALGPDVRSLAYNVRLQAEDRTLTESEVNDVRAACIAAVAKSHRASLR